MTTVCTAEEIKRVYCAAVGCNDATFAQRLVVMPCNCGAFGCEGWVVVPNNPKAIREQNQQYQQNAKGNKRSPCKK